MNNLIYIIALIALVGCEKVEIPTLEKHELTLICVSDKVITLYDTTLNETVNVVYSYSLFQCELLTITRAYYKNQRPTFTFLCDVETKTYYRL